MKATRNSHLVGGSLHKGGDMGLGADLGLAGTAPTQLSNPGPRPPIRHSGPQRQNQNCRKTGTLGKAGSTLQNRAGGSTFVLSILPAQDASSPGPPSSFV